MRPTLIIAAAAGFAALPILTDPASAGANRTFVSGFGSDSNPCTLTAPCRSFAQALAQTNAGGEIAVLDTAGYGSVTINKSVSIVNQDGVEGGVTTASATDAITVNLGSSDVVNLRGLTLVGGGVGTNGITFNNLGTLNIQNCAIRGFTGNGINLAPTGTAVFHITDTIVSDNSAHAIEIATTGSNTTVTAVFNRVQASDAGFEGFLINGTGSTGRFNVTIANSIASNTGTGIFTASTSGAAITNVMVVNSVVSNNGTGIGDSGGNSETLLARNTIFGNTFAYMNSGGALVSFGDNDIRGNIDDGAAIPIVATK